MTKPYHHGNLIAAMLDAVQIETRRSGLKGVSIRACARRIGVSHGAAFKHFRDKQHLLTAYATRSARRMADRMRAEMALAQKDEEFLYAGIGYVRFAMENPEAFRAVFREELINAADAEYQQAMDLLNSILSMSGGGSSGDKPLTSEALLAWSAVHGIASLYVDGSLKDSLPDGDPIPLIKSALVKLRPLFSQKG